LRWKGCDNAEGRGCGAGFPDPDRGHRRHQCAFCDPGRCLRRAKAVSDRPTADFATIDEAIQTQILDKTSVQPKSAVLAIAGPIDGDEIQLTNCPWVVRPKVMAASLA
jgi:glucokinase